MASLSLAYSRPLIGVAISFTWIIPRSLLVVLVSAAILGLFHRPLPSQVAGLTWWTRHTVPKIDPALLAPTREL
jgi:hypothetical protein